MKPYRLEVSLVAFAFVFGSTAAQSLLTKLSGDVITANGASFQLKTTAGEKLDVRLSDQARLTARSPTDRSAIRQGVYLGTTAAPQPDGTLVASEVHVFPEAMRGTGEGHRPMPNDPVNTMTNATVASVSGAKTPDAASTGTVVAASSNGDGALRMTLHYRGGEKVVIVPDNTPIVMTEIGERAMLASGAHVVVYATPQPDGSLLAERVSIGKNGYAPLQ
jgi:hypothetical protein